MMLIFITPFSLKISRPFDDRDAVRSGQNGRLRETDKQTMFHDPGNARKRVRHRFRIANPAKRGVDYPVSAIRDESMAVLALPHRQGSGPLDRCNGFLDRLQSRS